MHWGARSADGNKDKVARMRVMGMGTEMGHLGGVLEGLMFRLTESLSLGLWTSFLIFSACLEDSLYGTTRATSKTPMISASSDFSRLLPCRIEDTHLEWAASPAITTNKVSP